MPKRNRDIERVNYAVTLREKIDANLAVQNLNKMLREEIEPTPARLGAVKLALNKVIPDLQAVALQVGSDRPMTKADVDGLLLAAGIEPASVLGMSTIEGESEHVQPASDSD